MDACLSFTTVSIFTDHGHGSQFTDLWMDSFMDKQVLDQYIKYRRVQRAPAGTAVEKKARARARPPRVRTQPHRV